MVVDPVGRAASRGQAVGSDSYGHILCLLASLSVYQANSPNHPMESVDGEEAGRGPGGGRSGMDHAGPKDEEHTSNSILRTGLREIW